MNSMYISLSTCYRVFSMCWDKTSDTRDRPKTSIIATFLNDVDIDAINIDILPLQSYRSLKFYQNNRKNRNKVIYTCLE